MAGTLGLVLDCTDPTRLAEFWTAALGCGRRRPRRAPRTVAPGRSRRPRRTSHVPAGPQARRCFSQSHDPLAHWPTPVTQEVQRLLDQLVVGTRDWSDTESLTVLDQRSPTPTPTPSPTAYDKSVPPCSTASTWSTRRCKPPTTSNDRSSTSTATASPPASTTSTGRSAATDHDSPCGTGDAGRKNSTRPSADASTTSPIPRSPRASHGSQLWSPSGRNTIPDGHVSDVQHLIRDIAAYRERANHGDPNDPLGPPPHHPALHRQHIDLDRHLHTTPTQQPDQSLSR